MAPNVQIFVALLDDGTVAWRPVIAIHESSDIYRIVSDNVDPEGEHWQFQTGELVRCKPNVFADGSKGLVAFEKAPHIVPK